MSSNGYTNGHAKAILNVALVGVGEVAMTTHLPTLLLCHEMFKTVAICDISELALEHCAAKYSISATYTDVPEMLKGSPEIDLVFILNANEYHVKHAVQCMDAGKHVMIEKPMALTLGGADEIEATRARTGKVAFVGYMRRYATAFLRVKELVHALPAGQINYVRVRDIIGFNDFFVQQSGTFPQKFTDFPAASGAERAELGKAMNKAALNGKSENKNDIMTWMLLNGLSSHDLSAMRELIGMPKRVLKATRAAGGLFNFVLFEYDGFVAYYETGIDGVRQFDAHIEIYAKDKHIKVTYDTPYIKGLPITATIISSNEHGDYSKEEIRPTYQDAYTLEYKRLYAAITQGEEVKTHPLDAKQDLEMFTMIMEAMEDIA